MGRSTHPRGASVREAGWHRRRDRAGRVAAGSCRYPPRAVRVRPPAGTCSQPYLDLTCPTGPPARPSSLQAGSMPRVAPGLDRSRPQRPPGDAAAIQARRLADIGTGCATPSRSGPRAWRAVVRAPALRCAFLFRNSKEASFRPGDRAGETTGYAAANGAGREETPDAAVRALRVVVAAQAKTPVRCDLGYALENELVSIGMPRHNHVPDPGRGMPIGARVKQHLVTGLQGGPHGTARDLQAPASMQKPEPQLAPAGCRQERKGPGGDRVLCARLARRAAANWPCNRRRRGLWSPRKSHGFFPPRTKAPGPHPDPRPLCTESTVWRHSRTLRANQDRSPDAPA